VDSDGGTIDFMLSPYRDLTAAKHFLRLALSGKGRIRPRVINVDGHPAYARAISELKQSGELGRSCRCRPLPYLNSILEQDHRFIKKRIATSLWFRSVYGALNTIDGYEAMNMLRKGQVRWLAKAMWWAKSISSNACSVSLRNTGPELYDRPSRLRYLQQIR
jgi:transposase, IS6 family